MFGASVVLLLEHDRSRGSRGVILNRPLRDEDRRRARRRAEELLATPWLTPDERARARGAARLLRAGARLGGPVGVADFPFSDAVVLSWDGCAATIGPGAAGGLR